MRSRNILKNQQGFTLIEIIAVLILLGILAAVAVPKYLDLTENAKNKAVDAGIAELNSRESVAWGKLKLSTSGWTADALPTDTALGADYDWSTDNGATITAPTTAGGSLSFQKGTSIQLDRTASTLTQPGTWKRH